MVNIISMRDIYESYKKWVSDNPQTASDVETTVKWVSYFIAGRISSSNILSELIYSLSNILVLFNDRIIEKAHSLSAVTDGINYRLKLMLTSLEYCEVFIEISAKKLWGERGRWFFIIVVQIFKCIARLLLTRQYSEEIIRIPPIPALDRKKIAAGRVDTIEAGPSDDEMRNHSKFLFKLKRSGKTIRKVEGAPPIHLRSFRPLEEEFACRKTPNSSLRSAENLYIAKPLIHLGAVGLFGYRSWTSYSVSLLIDLISIRMYYNQRHSLTKQQRVELSRRCVNLLLYLVRSPFYEKKTENRLKGLLQSVANNIPLARAICNPLIEYIPHWQNTYFYMWSS